MVPHNPQINNGGRSVGPPGDLVPHIFVMAGPVEHDGEAAFALLGFVRRILFRLVVLFRQDGAQSQVGEQSIELTITRGEITIPIVNWTMIPETQIALVRLSQFSEKASSSMISALQDAKAAGAKALIVDVAVFDLYEGKGVPEGKKSIGLAVTLQPREKTLTDAEIDAVAQKIVAEAEKKCGATLRG